MAYMVVDFNHVFCKLNPLKIKQALCKILIKTIHVFQVHFQNLIILVHLYTAVLTYHLHIHITYTILVSLRLFSKFMPK